MSNNNGKSPKSAAIEKFRARENMIGNTTYGMRQRCPQLFRHLKTHLCCA